MTGPKLVGREPTLGMTAACATIRFTDDKRHVAARIWTAMFDAAPLIAPEMVIGSQTHTPAPWIQDGRLVSETNGDAVAMVNIARPVNIAHADARLIAAAPELLSALRVLVQMHEDGKLAHEITDNQDNIDAIMRWKKRWDEAFDMAIYAINRSNP